MADVNPLKEDGTPKSPEEIEQEKKTLEEGTHVPGSKTDSVLLLQSLQEERGKRKELEDRIALLESSHSSDHSTDDIETLKADLQDSNARIDALTLDKDKSDLISANPVLKEKWEEFETFRNDPENTGMSMKTAAKAFLAENGLLDPSRKGLEETTGGPRENPSQGMSVEEIKNLRETNFPKYKEMVKKGQIKV